ncbi:hypothetical protein BH11ACT8_BH11ACT8_11390 [soil metagenome]
MTKPGRVLVAIACLSGALLVSAGPGPAAASAGQRAAPRVDDPTHTVEVAGAGVGTYPAFAPDVSRYAVTTSAATGGSVTVTAATSDPAGVVYVDGRVAPGGQATVTGLVEGDEVAVWIDDVTGRSAYSYVYLPAGFPTLEAVRPEAGSLTPGLVMLGLSNDWFNPTADFFEAAVDRRGVPAHVLSVPQSRDMDLKLQPNGSYSVARTTTTAGRTGEAIVELDERFHEVARHETVGLVNTDGHDAILEPDGTAWLMAYEPNDQTGLVDSVIQRVDPDGTVGFEWTSAPYANETVVDPTNPDYAHVNSFEVLPDGDLLASFRNLSAVYKIGTSTPTGSVVWKLGGRDSDFAILDQQGEPDGGPCAQHSARLLPDGGLVLFDNGSSSIFGNLCIDPADPTGEAVQRVQTRLLRLSLDEQSGVATIVGSVAPEGRYSLFAGNTQPLAAGHLMVGWASAAMTSNTHAIATELDAADQEIWELRDVNDTDAQRYFSYRATLADVPDATAPTVSVDEPAAGASYVQGDAVVPSYTCRDRGGSSLATCTATAVDTSTPGRHTVSVTATDGAGNTTTVTRGFRVLASYRPDALVRAGRAGAWVGDGRYGSAGSQRVVADLRSRTGSTVVRLRRQNDGARPDRFRYDVNGASRRFAVSADRRRHGRTPVLAPGQSWMVQVTVRRTARARPGHKVVVWISARSLADGSLVDGASARVSARR